MYGIATHAVVSIVIDVSISSRSRFHRGWRSSSRLPVNLQRQPTSVRHTQLTFLNAGVIRWRHICHIQSKTCIRIEKLTPVLISQNFSQLLSLSAFVKPSTIASRQKQQLCKSRVSVWDNYIALLHLAHSYNKKSPMYIRSMCCLAVSVQVCCCPITDLSYNRESFMWSGGRQTGKQADRLLPYRPNTLQLSACCSVLGLTNAVLTLTELHMSTLIQLKIRHANTTIQIH